MEELFYLAEDLGLEKGKDFDSKVEHHSATFTFTEKQKGGLLRDEFMRRYAEGLLNIDYITNLKKSAISDKFSFKITIR
ncbi:hypothetical protein PZB74_09465 [Porifericola rhodea]|uniref:hypothetical protein n=1 Tax=Porifericola rhodea TaxID=930972 RepID=UPI002666B0B2|nr:hypothetical protein [Porifericola rhodea]WKN33558.1 hypothetical protein PZB74_09465 [Porifericola rhodea]